MFFSPFIAEPLKQVFSQVAPLAIAPLCFSVGIMNSTLNFIDGHQISYAVAGACALFLFLLLLFELLRTRLYWIYEPRVHRDDYKSKTPPAPGRTPFSGLRSADARVRARRSR